MTKTKTSLSNRIEEINVLKHALKNKDDEIERTKNDISKLKKVAKTHEKEIYNHENKNENQGQTIRTLKEALNSLKAEKIKLEKSINKKAKKGKSTDANANIPIQTSLDTISPVTVTISTASTLSAATSFPTSTLSPASSHLSTTLMPSIVLPLSSYFNTSAKDIELPYSFLDPSTISPTRLTRSSNQGTPPLTPTCLSPGTPPGTPPASESTSTDCQNNSQGKGFSASDVEQLRQVYLGPRH